MSICIRCKQEFESEHSDYVCDDCHLLSIRKRIDGNTSYPTHIADLRFLMKRYDEERAAHNEHMTELCQLEKEKRKLREQLQRTVELYQFECRRREEETEERDKLVEALREIDTYIRGTRYPLPYIAEVLKNTLPEYEEER
jgi:predicted nuclease with TOPRIM domain